MQLTWSFGKVYSRIKRIKIWHDTKVGRGGYTACVELMVCAAIFFNELNIIFGVPN
jgi:hypothetical protein